MEKANGTTTIDGKHGCTMTITITPNLMHKNLWVPNHQKDLSKWMKPAKKDFIFIKGQSKNLTHKDLKNQDIFHTLWLVN